jgi:hypothetical protein
MPAARWAFVAAGLACIVCGANHWIRNQAEAPSQTRPLPRTGRPDNRATAALDVPDAVAIAMQCDSLLNQYRAAYFLRVRDGHLLAEIGSLLRSKLYELDANYKILPSEGKFSYNVKRLAAEFNIMQRKHLQAYMALLDVLQNPRALSLSTRANIGPIGRVCPRRACHAQYCVVQIRTLRWRRRTRWKRSLAWP